MVTGTHGGIPGRGRLGLSFGYFTKTVDDQIDLLELTVGTPEYREVTPLSPLIPLNRQVSLPFCHNATLFRPYPIRRSPYESDISISTGIVRLSLL